MKICIYGASGQELPQPYFDAARELGRLLAEEGHTLIFGGGAHGLMGACAEGVSEKGGEIIGIAPRFFDEPGILYPHCSRFVYTETMAQRKTAMFEESEAFIALPGGIGTFEEFFEVLTLKQLGRHEKAIIIYNFKGYYTPLLEMMDAAMRDSFMAADTRKLYTVAETEEEVFRQLEEYKSFSYNKYRRWYGGSV